VQAQYFDFRLTKNRSGPELAEWAKNVKKPPRSVQARSINSVQA